MKLRNHSKGFKDVANHSLGTEVVGGNFDIIIPKCSNIPMKISKNYHTTRDNQESISVKVFEGKSKYYYNNLCIDPLPTGEAEIRVTFKIDENSVGI